MNRHIMVVDDSEMNLKVAEALLGKYKFTCDLFSGPQDAFNALLQKDYCMILMDYMMPVMDGMEAAKHIRGMSGGSHPDDYYKSIPIIALTAEDNPSLHIQMLKSGINDIMPKPVKGELLLSMYSKLCGGSSEPDSLQDNQTTETAHAADSDIKKNSDSRKNSSAASRASAPAQDASALHGISREVLDEMMSLDSQGFIDVLSIFLEDAGGKIKRITSAFSAADYAEYTVEVHRLKSEAKIVGATKLAESARELEFAGKAITGVIPNGHSEQANIAFIKVKTPGVINMLSSLANDIPAFIEAYKKETVSAASSDAAPVDGSALSHITKDDIDKINRYISHAKEALASGEYNFVSEWLDEITEVINCWN